MKTRLLIFAALAASISLPAVAQTAAQTTSRDRMKTCSADAKTQGLKGAPRKTFMSDCLKSAAATPTAPAAATAAPAAPAPVQPAPSSTRTAAPAPASTPAGKPASSGRVAEQDRMRDCGRQWKVAKAGGQVPAGQKWPQYWSACNARLKAGG